MAGRTLTTIAAGAVTGCALGVLGIWAAAMFGPETLYHIGEAVYDADGTYHGLR